MNWANIDRPV